MLKLKNLLKEDVKIQTTNKAVGYIYQWKEEMEKGKFDPKNPTLVIIGLGSYDLKTLKSSIAGQLLDLSKRLKGGSEMDVDNVYSLLVKNDTLLYKVKALKDVQDELRTSLWKRRITIYKRR
jgi:hypothetical protein|tara:strand:- start:1022 stop:1387 length:366 start_codon:yes stop_codon:yes gene_type:complete